MAHRMKILSIIILGLVLSGCSLMNVKTEIKNPDGKVWKIDGKSDAYIAFKTKDVEIIDDRRERPSTLETAFGLAMTKTNINLGLSNKPQEVSK